MRCRQPTESRRDGLGRDSRLDQLIVRKNRSPPPRIPYRLYTSLSAFADHSRDNRGKFFQVDQPRRVMGMNIKDCELHAMARQLAARRGTT